MSTGAAVPSSWRAYIVRPRIATLPATRKATKPARAIRAMRVTRRRSDRAVGTGSRAAGGSRGVLVGTSRRSVTIDDGIDRFAPVLEPIGWEFRDEGPNS